VTDIAEVSENEWKEYLEKLTFYASWKFNRLGWRIKRGFESTSRHGVSPQDIAAESIVSVLEGKRKYNKAAYPDFYIFLRSIVDSKIYHLYKSMNNRKIQEKPIPQVITENGVLKDIEFESSDADPARLCINKDIAMEAEKILAEEFHADDVVNKIIECLKAGITKPADIAELQGIQINEIYNAQKRLQRAVDKKLKGLSLEYRK